MVSYRIKIHTKSDQPPFPAPGHCECPKEIKGRPVIREWSESGISVMTPQCPNRHKSINYHLGPSPVPSPVPSLDYQMTRTILFSFPGQLLFILLVLILLNP